LDARWTHTKNARSNIARRPKNSGPCSLTDQRSRDTLEEIAAGYDQLAVVQESLAKADRITGKL
jgi:hypothetical protein